MKEVLEYCLDDNNDEVQALAAEGISKLMLTQRLKDESVSYDGKHSFFFKKKTHSLSASSSFGPLVLSSSVR